MEKLELTQYHKHPPPQKRNSKNCSMAPALIHALWGLPKHWQQKPEANTKEILPSALWILLGANVVEAAVFNPYNCQTNQLKLEANFNQTETLLINGTNDKGKDSGQVGGAL